MMDSCTEYWLLYHSSFWLNSYHLWKGTLCHLDPTRRLHLKLWHQSTHIHIWPPILPIPARSLSWANVELHIVWLWSGQAVHCAAQFGQEYIHSHMCQVCNHQWTQPAKLKRDSSLWRRHKRENCILIKESQSLHWCIWQCQWGSCKTVHHQIPRYAWSPAPCYLFDLFPSFWKAFTLFMHSQLLAAQTHNLQVCRWLKETETWLGWSAMPQALLTNWGVRIPDGKAPMRNVPWVSFLETFHTLSLFCQPSIKLQ